MKGRISDVDWFCLWVVLEAREVVIHAPLLWVHVQVAAAQTTQAFKVMPSNQALQYSLSDDEDKHTGPWDSLVLTQIVKNSGVRKTNLYYICIHYITLRSVGLFI
jgi:hypothetical protein